MDDMERVLSGIRVGEEIGSIQDALGMEDTVIFSILVELVRRGDVIISVA